MLQNILINLNILSKIKPYDKIYINKDNLITIEYNSIFQGFYRFFYNNSRDRNLTNLIIFYQSVYTFIDDLLNSKFLNIENIVNYIKSDNDDFNKIFSHLNKILEYLILSIGGIQNLKKTYHSDIVTDSKLDIIINNSEMYIEKIKKKIKIINSFQTANNQISNNQISNNQISNNQISNEDECNINLNESKNQMTKIESKNKLL